LEFSLVWHGVRLRVTVEQHQATYSLRDGHDGAIISLLHHGERITVTTDKPVVVTIPTAVQLTPRPQQPRGRAPQRHSPQPS
jgi:alpha,alpha-trehalose phosphorylase